MRRFLTCLLLILTSFALAGEIKETVAPKERLTKHVFLLVDVSGSITTKGKIPDALKAIRMITKQDTDDMEIALMVFDSNQARWPGIPDEHTRAGWAKLPSEEAVKQAQGFVELNTTAGGTWFQGPLQTALQEKREDLSIVLISDGDNNQEGDDSILGTVSKAQELREKEYGRAVIYVIDLTGDEDWMRQLASQNGGGHYVQK